MYRLLALTAWTIGLTVALIALGGIVRVTGAGLACPDWPLCRGRLVPPLEGLVIIEYGHRLLASLLGVLTVVLAARVWRASRGDPGLRWIAAAAVVVLGWQVVLGGLTVRTGLTPALVVAHLSSAMGFLTVLALLYSALSRRLRGTPAVPPPVRSAAVWAAAAALAQILLGGYVSASGAALACPDLPLCGGRLIPPLTGSVGIHFAHRLGALVVLGSVAWLYTQARAVPSALRRPAVIAGALVLAQITLGALNVALRLPPVVSVAHLLVAALLLATLAGAVGLVWPAPAIAPRRRLREVTADYVALTKPRIIRLLLATTVATMVAAAGGLPAPGLLAATLLGGALASGAANAINCYWDRDVDAIMPRTRGRPVPAGRIVPRQALRFGIILAVLSVAVLGLLVNWLSAGLAFAGILFYVLVYTMWLKRTTPRNIVIGGAAGAIPPLVGWAAVTGRIGLTAILLFLVIFLWTPPHFWALALNKREDYAAARIPMLPVVAGEAETTRQIVRYTFLLVGVTLLLVPLGGAGLLYLVTALLLGAGFIGMALRLARQRDGRSALRLFAYSIAYLVLLFSAVAIDRLV